MSPPSHSITRKKMWCRIDLDVKRGVLLLQLFFIESFDIFTRFKIGLETVSRMLNENKYNIELIMQALLMVACEACVISASKISPL